MAIKIKGITAITNDRRGTFRMVNVGTYSDAVLKNNTIVGQQVGDTVYNQDEQYTMSWLGTTWANSVANFDRSVDSFTTTASFPTPSNCNTVVSFTPDRETVAGFRNASVGVADLETYTFMATLKFENPEVDLWTAWSSESDDVFTNLVGKRDISDFSDFFFPSGYAQKQLTETGDDGDEYYTNDVSNGTYINWKSLVYAAPHALNALNVLYQNSEFANLRVSRFSGNFDIKYDETTASYSFERTYYNELNQRVDKIGRVILDANGDRIDNDNTSESAVNIGFLGSAKNGSVFELIRSEKVEGYFKDVTLSWKCPENKSLVGFFYVVKNLTNDISISQPLKINPDEVDRASYLQGQKGVGNVIECKPGVDMNVTLGDFDDKGLLEYYPSPDDTSWSLRYAIWSVSN